MARHSLTQKQGDALEARQHAIRTDVHLLVTRTAFSQWQEDGAPWICTHDRLRVAHTRGFRTGTCFPWSARDTQFVPCNCGR